MSHLLCSLAMVLDAQSVLVGACLPAGVWLLALALRSRPVHADSKPRPQPLKVRCLGWARTGQVECSVHERSETSAGRWLGRRALLKLHAHWELRRLYRESALVSQVAITGSTKGLGLALAESFLELGDDVVRLFLELASLPVVLLKPQRRLCNLPILHPPNTTSADLAGGQQQGRRTDIRGRRATARALSGQVGPHPVSHR